MENNRKEVDVENYLETEGVKKESKNGSNIRMCSLMSSDGRNYSNEESELITTESLSYESCSGCNKNSHAEVIFHSHVSQFDHLVKLIAIVGEYFNTHSNISVVVAGDPLFKNESKNNDLFKHEPEIKLECNNEVGDQEGESRDDCNENKDGINIDIINIDGISVTKPEIPKKEKVKLSEREPKHVYCCDECGKTFKERSSLYRHRKVTHEKVEKYMNRSKLVKDYTCPVCNEVIHDTYQRYFQHKQMCEAKTTGVNPYVCSICGRSFPTSNQHGNHYTSCSGKAKKYYNTQVCLYEDCDYRTSHKIELDNHVRRTHLNLPISKNHVCTLCGNAYNKLKILKQHVKEFHLNEKPHECPTCGRCFARKQKMKDHMKIHTGESKYTCPLCNKNFNNKDSRWHHKKSCPGMKEQIVQSLKPDPVICP